MTYESNSQLIDPNDPQAVFASQVVNSPHPAQSPNPTSDGVLPPLIQVCKLQHVLFIYARINN